MKKIFIILIPIAGLLILYSVFVGAQQDQREWQEEQRKVQEESGIKNMLPGMKAVPVGSAKLVIPEGAQVRRVTPGLIVPQTAGEYIAQELPAMKEKLAQAETGVAELKEQLGTDSAMKEKKQEEIAEEEAAERKKDNTPGILISG
ncbi:MAG: hypothetical protein ISS33_06645 [Candidatus Omnitrophica bacterium]|nr:hypothetical protein [Candidatus Omnitrophota bacterium]